MHASAHVCACVCMFLHGGEIGPMGAAMQAQICVPVVLPKWLRLCSESTGRPKPPSEGRNHYRVRGSSLAPSTTHLEHVCEPFRHFKGGREESHHGG